MAEEKQRVSQPAPTGLHDSARQPPSASSVERPALGPSQHARRPGDFFSRDEVRALTRRSNLMGAWSILSTWAVIALAFAAIAWGWSLPLGLAVPVVLLALAVLAGRQVALAILTHEATHKTLFDSRWANDVLTDWLCGRPVGLDLHKYRAHHFIHHSKTGTDEDTDISLIEGLPTTPASMRRKILRDLSGITGLKFLLGRVLMDAEQMKWTVATNVEWLPKRGWRYHLAALARNSFPSLLTNLILFALLYASGYPWLYLAWVIAYLIPYPLFIRLRALAEHAGTERSSDMFRNTRTTRAGLIASTFIAPFRVNYHLEHHVMASVPWFRLKKMHQILRERGVVADPPGYGDVMRIVVSRSDV